MPVYSRKPNYAERKGPAFPLAAGQRGYLAMASGAELTKQQIQTVLGTRRGERVMRPTYGSRLPELVFAPWDTPTLRLAETYAREAIVGNVTGIRLGRITAEKTATDSSVRLVIEYDLTDTGARDEVEYLVPSTRT